MPIEPTNTPYEGNAAETSAECMSCKRTVPAKQIVVLGGRSLCFGCASAWFEEGDE